MSLGVDGQIPRVVKLPVLRALFTKFEKKRPVKCEDLNAMVVFISDDDASQLVGSYACWTIKLTRSSACRAESVMEYPSRIEDLIQIKVKREEVK